MTFIYILVALFFIVLLTCVIFTGSYLNYINHFKCKKCGNTMKYKGVRKNNEDEEFMFHCEKCGAWEQVPFSKVLESNKEK